MKGHATERHSRSQRPRQRGFSLIELLIVVAIILIISAIALPSLLKSRMAANEASAVNSLRSYTSAEVGFAAQCPNVGYSPTLVALGPGPGDCTGTNMVDSILGGSASPQKSGYQFSYLATAGGTGLNITYTLTALPLAVGSSGQRGFYADQSGVLRYTTDGSAPTNTDSPIS